MTEKKDRWDKFEILAKGIGAVLIPIVVGYSVSVFNARIAERDASAQLISIAVSVLMEPIGEQSTIDPLRSWAVDVLQNPDKVIHLTDEAAVMLRRRGLPTEIITLQKLSELKEMWKANP